MCLCIFLLLFESISHSYQSVQVIVMADGKVYYQGKVGEVKKFDPDLYDSWRKAIRDARASEHKNM